MAEHNQKQAIEGNRGKKVSLPAGKYSGTSGHGGKSPLKTLNRHRNGGSKKKRTQNILFRSVR